MSEKAKTYGIIRIDGEWFAKVDNGATRIGHDGEIIPTVSQVKISGQQAAVLHEKAADMGLVNHVIEWEVYDWDAMEAEVKI